MRLTGAAAGSDGAYRYYCQPGMAKPVKGGYLLRYKKRLFGKAWREEWVTLFDDSTIAWFKEKDRGEPEGYILVKEAPEMTAVGQWTLRIPGRPELPSNCHLLQLMAFGNKRRDKVHWLLAKNEEEVNDWMTAISNTLPSHAQVQKPSEDKDNSTPNLDSVNPRLPPVSYYSSVSGDSLSRYTSSSNHLGAVYPESTYLQSAGATIFRDRVGSGIGDLSAGVLMGATLNSWGQNWAWKHGLGTGIGYCNNDHADININHHFDLHNTIINHQDTHHYSCDDFGDLEFGCGDYGMDCSGDFGSKMALVHYTYSGRKEIRHFSTGESSQTVSPLIILQARFQQKQLQEKEEKLLKLYEEQQERALKSVGSRSHSGGSSVSSTSSVGVGKVRYMFQSRRENSEPRLGAVITGRDKSYPLVPLTKYPSARNINSDYNHGVSTSRNPTNWGLSTHQRSFSLDRSNINLYREKNEKRYDLNLNENFNREKIGVRRTQSQAKNQKPYFKNYNLDFGQSFKLVDDNFDSQTYDRNAYADADDYFLTNFNTKRQFYENREKSEQNNNQPKSKSSPKFPNHESGNPQPSKMEGKYKSYVSQTSFSKKPHLGNGTLTGRTGITTRQTSETKETNSSGYLNGSMSSPVRKIRKPTPVPLSVAPPQHFLQKEIRKTTRIETIREVPSSTTSTKTPTSRTQSSTSSLQKPPTHGKSVILTKSTTSTPSATKSVPPSDLVNCRICGRHFAADRVFKHEEVCQKSSKTKRKPFDALQQRVKGTEVEQFIKKTPKSLKTQTDKVTKPQSNWRKKHEEFINNIRAAKEVSIHLKKGGKLSELPPPPPSDYSDYVPCPHCGRKFNSSAAERHIPKCANIINNKPKPTLQKNVGLKQTSKLLHSSTSSSTRGRK